MSRFNEAFKNRDFVEFHKRFRESLNEELTQAMYGLEDTLGSVENRATQIIQLNAKFCGAYQEDFAYEAGVILVEIPTKQGAIHFSDFLEGCEYVDSYEMLAQVYDTDEGKFEDEEVDIETISDDQKYRFQFVIYLYSNAVTYSDYDIEVEYDDEDESMMEEGFEPLQEVKRKIRVNFRGKKTIKYKCARGFRWNENTKTCVKITGDELVTMRRAVRKALITKKNEGNAFKKRVIRKRNKALKYRKNYGL